MQLLSCAIILCGINGLIPFIIFIFVFPCVFLDNSIVKNRDKWNRRTTTEKRKINYLKHLLNGRKFSKEIRVFGVCFLGYIIYLHTEI